jgi:hypothetical protein
MLCPLRHHCHHCQYDDNDAGWRMYCFNVVVFCNSGQACDIMNESESVTSNFSDLSFEWGFVVYSKEMPQHLAG